MQLLSQHSVQSGLCDQGCALWVVLFSLLASILGVNVEERTDIEPFLKLKDEEGLVAWETVTIWLEKRRLQLVLCTCFGAALLSKSAAREWKIIKSMGREI